MDEIVYQLKKLIDTEISVNLYFNNQSFFQVHIDNVTEDYVMFHSTELDFDQKENNLEDTITSKLIRYFYSLEELKGISYCIISIPTGLQDLDSDGQVFLQ